KLREQADALRSQAAELQRTEQKFRSLLEAAPDSMVVCREDGEIVMVNSQTEILFHCARENLISRNIRSLVPRWEYRFHPDWDADSNATMSPPVERGIELEAFPEDGAPFQAELS